MVTVTNHGVFPGEKLKGAERYRRLYHFTSFDTFVKIWLTKKLRFSPTKNVNDILEVRTSVSLHNHQQQPLIYAYLDCKAKFKQISLTMDYDSYMYGCMAPMMWGYYADKRKGVCIQLDYEKLALSKPLLYGPVRYVKYLPHTVYLDRNIKSIRDINRFIHRNKKTLFFTKDKSWAGENEFRILSDTRDFLDIADAISCVYLTEYDSTECLLVEKLVDNAVPVKCIRYTGRKGNLAIPVLVDTKRIRSQFEEAKSNPQNALNQMAEQAKEHYLTLKHDEKASLIKEFYIFPEETQFI